MKYYPYVKRNKVLIHATTWKIFKNIMLSDMHAQSCLTLCGPMDYSPPPNPQALLFMRFSRQEYWTGLPCPPPGDLPDTGIEPVSPALAGRFFTTEPHGKPRDWLLFLCNYIIPSLIAISSFIIAT